MAAQALDGLGYGGIDLLGQAEHIGQGLDVTVPDAAGVGCGGRTRRINPIRLNSAMSGATGALRMWRNRTG